MEHLPAEHARATGMTRRRWSWARAWPGSPPRIRLAQGGASVTVVAKGAGGLHLSPGTIDVLGYAPERVDDARRGPAAPSSPAAPSHPYARLAPEPLGEALEWFRGLVAGLCATTGDPGRNMLLPTAVGAVRPTALAPGEHRGRATCAAAARAWRSSGCAR